MCQVITTLSSTHTQTQKKKKKKKDRLDLCIKLRPTFKQVGRDQNFTASMWHKLQILVTCTDLHTLCIG